MTSETSGIAKVTWEDPASNDKREFVLMEGATASVGRASTNDICIPERHVSRQHAVIAFRDGIFMISDLGSANGTFVNDQRLTNPFPLAHGDIIRLYVPTLIFSAIVTEEDESKARETGTLIAAAVGQGTAHLLVTAGPQEGTDIPLSQTTMTVGRLTTDSKWDIALQDRAISRPHCKFEFTTEGWTVVDLNSANGTQVNGAALTSTPHMLKDGDVLAMGETTLLFRLPA